MKYLALILSLVVLNSCASVGTANLEDFGNYVTLKPGVTSKTNVFDTFGQPADVIYEGPPSSSASKWTYVKADMHVSGWSYVPWVGLLFGGVSEDNMVAKINFDSKGLFKSLNTEKDSNYTNQWLGITREAYRAAKDPKAARVAEEMTRLGKPFDKKFARKLAERRLD
jgi:hypothetical protein